MRFVWLKAILSGPRYFWQVEWYQGGCWCGGSGGVHVVVVEVMLVLWRRLLVWSDVGGDVVVMER